MSSERTSVTWKAPSALWVVAVITTAVLFVLDVTGVATLVWWQILLPVFAVAGLSVGVLLVVGLVLLIAFIAASSVDNAARKRNVRRRR